MFSSLPASKSRLIHSQLSSQVLLGQAYCVVGPEAQKLLETAVTRLGLSARAYDHILKVAGTIADLAGEETISTIHVSEAIQYRMMDRYY